MNKRVYIVGGGTHYPLTSHLSLSSVAYGGTAKILKKLCEEHPSNKMDIELQLTKMCDQFSTIDTYKDLKEYAEKISRDPLTKIVFWSPSVVDFGIDVFASDGLEKFSRPYSDRPRLTSSTWHNVDMYPLSKLNRIIRDERSDIFLVSFKHSHGCFDEETIYNNGLKMLKNTSSNLVLANDTKSGINMIITPEESSYHVSKDRYYVLENLVDMSYLRSHLTFTKSTVVAGESISWDSHLIPDSLRTVINYCIDKGAYKTVTGVTAGHFACKVNDNTFITSKRKTNFNQLKDVGMVLVETSGPDTVIAYGAKPSVGGQSQRIIFNDHKEHGLDCIVHFHCEKLKDSKIPVASQRGVQCGSHFCGKNTSDNLIEMEDGIFAVFLENHGPNIVFNRNIDPQRIINFINNNFDLNTKTGGYKITTAS